MGAGRLLAREAPPRAGNGRELNFFLRHDDSSLSAFRLCVNGDSIPLDVCDARCYIPGMKSGSQKPLVIVSSSQKAMRVPRRRIAKLVEFVARAEGSRVSQVDIAVMDSRKVAQINRQYLHHAGDTDVITFDLSDNTQPGIVAQIVVCGDVAVREAKARNIPASRELLLYVAHGLLHLMGYEDQSVRGRAAMHARQDELLDEFLH
jgi:probable rRNA maturation factor